MKYLIAILLIAWVIWIYFFMGGNNKSNNKQSTEGFSPLNNINNINMENLKEAYFAWGCFWCMEWIFEAQPWVSEAITWYIGWDAKTANYTDVSTWKTAHREWIKVIYDPEIISFDKLAELFWTQIDPTDEGWQFADRWFQYTTAMFYSNDLEKEILEKSKKALEDSKKFNKKIATKILPFKTFFDAEEYHQNYYKKSSTRYKLYKKASGREGFIEDNWEDRIEALEGEKNIKGQTQDLPLQENECRGESCVHPNSGYKDYSPELVENAKNKNIVLFFHADWCPTCKAFEKKVLTEKIPENLLILKVDFDTNTELRKKYNILTQTSFVLIDNKWNLIKRWIWARQLSDILEKIDESISGKSVKSETYTDKQLRAKLTPLQYKVAVEGWTEPPFNNKYWDNHKEWIYVDVIDWTPLFSSTDKFDSGTGWPSFTKPIDDNFIEEKDDYKLLSKRTEIRTSTSHLWHVFNDWPSDKGWMRYCINSASLNFIPKEDLKGSEYEKYLKLFN